MTPRPGRGPGGRTEKWQPTAKPITVIHVDGTPWDAWTLPLAAAKAEIAARARLGAVPAGDYLLRSGGKVERMTVAPLALEI